MARARRLVALLAVAGAAVVGPVPLVAPASATSSPAGNDFSWPQCPKGVGNGQGKPLPTGSRRFEIVGLTNGAGFHENPCLVQQWRYASNHAAFVTGYTMLTYPTPAQLKASGSGHYGTCSTLTCRLRNNGWAQGAFADSSLRRIGARPPMVWVDVEPRTQQPWTRDTTKNRVVVQAAIASLQRHGYRVGVYSNRYLWQEVANYRTTLPEWVPSGSLTDGCSLPFSAGRVWVSQYTHTYASGDAYDENGLCRAAPKLSATYQPAHPTVTTSRDADTHQAYARFTDGRRFALRLAVVRRPAVVAVRSSVSGRIPLFVAVDTSHQLRARTMGSGWHVLGTHWCASTPGVAAGTATAWVGCRDRRHRLTLTRVALDADGAPTTTQTTVLDGDLAASPAVTLSKGGPAAVAPFRDGATYTRTLTAAWSPAGGASTAVPTAARL